MIRGAPRRCTGGAPAVLGLMALMAVVALPWLASQFHVSFATRVLLLILLALGFDLVWGYGGILSLGQGVFFGSGAYAVGLLATRAGVTSVLVAIPVAGLTGLVLSTLFGGFLFIGRRRVSLIFVALATLTASYASERLAASWPYVGAANGIPSVPLLTAGPMRLGPGTGFYYLALALVLGVLVVFNYLVRSQFGLLLRASRADEERLMFLGYDVARAKVLAFTVAGTVAGVAGGLYSVHEGFVSPNLLGVAISTQVVLWVLLGGPGTLVGPVIGVLAIEYPGFHLAETFPYVWPIILGGILLVGVMFLPDGLISVAVRWRAFVTRVWRPLQGTGVHEFHTGDDRHA